MKFLLTPILVLVVLPAFAVIPKDMKEYECRVESNKDILNSLVLIQSQYSDVTIQLAYSEEEAKINFLNAIAPRHYVIDNKITILGKTDDQASVTDQIISLDCDEIEQK